MQRMIEFLLFDYGKPRIGLLRNELGPRPGTREAGLRTTCFLPCSPEVGVAKCPIIVLHGLQSCTLYRCVGLRLYNVWHIRSQALLRWGCGRLEERKKKSTGFFILLASVPRSVSETSSYWRGPLNSLADQESR